MPQSSKVLSGTKNISPSKLAMMTAIVNALVCFGLVWFSGRNVWHASMASVVLFCISYVLFYQLLLRFIYRKIKLIYKFISQTKATKREEFYNSELLPQKTIEEVSADVEKWAEDRRGEIEILESNLQFRKEFLMNLAHELRTPIFSAQGYIDTLLDGAIEDEQVNITFLSNASKSIDRLASLVDDLDHISQLESNRIPLVKKEFIIQDLILDVFDELSQKAMKKNIIFSIKKGCESPITIFADEQKIRQVIVNLVENSIKYGKEKGHTSAGIYIVDEKTVFVEINDDGLGIAEEHVPRVFERFYRTDSARSRSIGGTGLGLAIVKHIIEAHGHTVTCRSKLDVGSSFGFTISRSVR